MPDVNINTQKLIPFATVNVAQVDAALIEYAADEDIVTGLTALRAELIAAVENAAACPQCGGAQASGKITKNAVDYVCPLCNGMTKTDGTYTPVFGTLLGYDKTT